MYYGPGKGVRNHCNRWLLQLLRALTLYQSLHGITVRRSALHGLCDRNSVCPSVRLSVCHTRALCPHGSTYDHDFFTIW